MYYWYLIFSQFEEENSMQVVDPASVDLGDPPKLLSFADISGACMNMAFEDFQVSQDSYINHVEPCH